MLGTEILLLFFLLFSAVNFDVNLAKFSRIPNLQNTSANKFLILVIGILFD